MAYSDIIDLSNLDGEENHLYSIAKICSPGSLDAISAKLQKLSRPELDEQMMQTSIKYQTSQQMEQSPSKKDRVFLWLLSKEYTRRNVPPVLQGLPDPCDDDPEQIGDAAIIDMLWIRAHMPNLKPAYGGWKVAITSSDSKAWWIGNRYPKKQIDWVCRGLGLNDRERRQLHFFRNEGFKNTQLRLDSQREDVWHRLEYAYEMRDSRYKTADQKATIDRRCEIWYVGHLAGWSPQLTAFFYEARTGEKMTRQLAASIIDQVHRDVPDSRPRKTARTRKK